MSSTMRRLGALLVGMLLATLVSGTAAAGSHYVGQLQWVHGDDTRSGRAVSERLVLKGDYDSATYTLAFSGRGPTQLAGKHVDVTGSRHGATVDVTSLAVAAGGSSSDTGTSTTVASTTKYVAVLLFNFQNDTRQPYTSAVANGVLFTNTNSVAAYFAEESYGQYAVDGAVYGWYTIPYDNTGCDYTTWASAARAQATAAGVTLGTYTNFVYAFPSAAGCGWSGLAYLPGTETWNNGSMTLRTNAHELSHNFGVHHASTISCTESGVRVALSANQANCSLAEYGDPFTVMGAAATRHSHGEHKAQMTWVPTADRLDVTSSSTVTVGVQEQSGASPKVVRVARAGATNQFFYLEFRQPFGTQFDNFTSTDPAVNGVSIRVAPDYPTRSQSWLIDTTPATSTYSDAPLAVGQTFTDPLSGVSFRTVSVSASGASVSVSFGGSSGGDTQAPSTPAGLGASGTGPMTMAVSWSASNDNVGVAGYKITRNGTQVATVTGTSWNDGGLSPSTTYSYAVTAYDAAGNLSSAASANGTTMSDTQTPSTPTNLVGTPSATSVALTWSASNDNVGVSGYRVSRDGTQVATVTGTSWSDSGLTSGMTYGYTVVAFDAAGNTSGSASTSVTTLTVAAPTAPVLSVTLNRKGQPKLSWTTSTSSVSLGGYRVFRNGVLVATTSKRTRNWTDTTSGPGTFQYYVVAYTTTGTLSAPSNTVTMLI